MKYLLIFISFVFIISCNGQKKTVAQSDETNIRNVKTDSLVLLLQEIDSSFDIEETMIIKDVKRLKSFYSKINMTRKPGIPVPDVDFSKEMIVVQCSGSVNQDGLPVLLFLNETDNEIILSSIFQKSESNPQKSVTSPFCIYKLPLSEKNIVIETNFK